MFHTCSIFKKNPYYSIINITHIILYFSWSFPFFQIENRPFGAICVQFTTPLNVQYSICNKTAQRFMHIPDASRQTSKTCSGWLLRWAWIMYASKKSLSHTVPGSARWPHTQRDAIMHLTPNPMTHPTPGLYTYIYIICIISWCDGDGFVIHLLQKSLMAGKLIEREIPFA